MRLQHAVIARLGLIGLLFILAGCQTALLPPAPVGPGAATDTDLTPWLAVATPAQQSGQLLEFNVPSHLGSYDTWALATTQPEQSSEIDIRPCAAAAERLRGKEVVIEGKLIARGPWHLPLLVASKIHPADEQGNALPDDGEQGPAVNSDPITGVAESPVEFHAMVIGEPSGRS